MASTMLSKVPGKLARVKPKTYSVCMLYNTNEAKEKLKSLSVANCNPSTENQQATYDSDTDKDKNVIHKIKLTVSDKMYCNCCDCVFEERKDQEQHYKSDWHRYNLRLKLGGLKSVKIEDFEKIANDVSSISGSEDDEEDSSDTESGPNRSKSKLAIPAHVRSTSVSGSSDSESEASVVKHGRNSANNINKYYLRNKDGELISLYKCLLYHKKSKITDQSELLEEIKTLPGKTKWAIFMSAGGHFAGAIYNGNQIVVHKTFHRYVVRAKRGTAQGSRDSQGNAPKSAGASLRRYNEAALMQEIQDWITAWSEQIKNCDFLFLRAPSFNRKIFYGGKNPPLKKNDDRVRVIPFPTRRPTYNEVKRVHEMLSSIECYGQESDLPNVIPISPMRQLSSETGQLEVVSDSELPPQKSKSKFDTSSSSKQLKDLSQEKSSPPPTDSRKSKSQQNHENIKLSLPDHILGYESGSTCSESELVETMTALSTEHLKEFDCSVKAPRKKSPKKRRKPITKHQVEPEEDVYDEESYHLQNALYTACKTGDTQTLSALLVVFRGMDVTPCVLTPAASLSTDTNRVNSLNSELSTEITCSADNSNCSAKTTADEPKSNFLPDGEIIIERVSSPDIISRTKNVESENLDAIDSTVSNRNDNQSQNAIPESRNSTGTSVPDSLPIPKFTGTMRFGGYTLDQLSPLVTVDILNKPFGDNGTTLLHVAAKCNHRKVISMLMKYGADPTVRDKSDRPPYAVAGCKDTRNEFRRFIAIYPDKYDYKKAQIPGALTAEKEEEKRQKEAERKRLQKKAKADKLKIQREEEAERIAEEKEKKRFLSLSDREKRLLAAERRLVNQYNREGADQPVLSRCYGCGTDITGKVPFEYSDFKFCTTKCLREHRSKTS
ncbi:hypothetical protein SNE40_022861 [Patella caerulea]|uniref:VLRF1 domain-containing protein n=1 Tax=Patella caerulea TaxID=87958 RepID=A0AAN8G540_PATCE